MRHGRQRVANQRGLAVPAGRDEEHLLAGRQVADQPVQLVDAVDERRGRHDFAVDEWVLHYGISYNEYGLYRNGYVATEPIRAS